METENKNNSKMQKEDFIKSPTFLIASLTFAALFILPFLLIIPLAIKLLN